METRWGLLGTMREKAGTHGRQCGDDVGTRCRHMRPHGVRVQTMWRQCGEMWGQRENMETRWGQRADHVGIMRENESNVGTCRDKMQHMRIHGINASDVKTMRGHCWDKKTTLRHVGDNVGTMRENAGTNGRQRGDNVGTRWGPGENMETRWGQRGDMWGQCRENNVTMWGQDAETRGHMGTGCKPCGVKLGTMWGQGNN